MDYRRSSISTTDRIGYEIPLRLQSLKPMRSPDTSDIFPREKFGYARFATTANLRPSNIPLSLLFIISHVVFQ